IAVQNDSRYVTEWVMEHTHARGKVTRGAGMGDHPPRRATFDQPCRDIADAHKIDLPMGRIACLLDFRDGNCRPARGTQRTMNGSCDLFYRPVGPIEECFLRTRCGQVRKRSVTRTVCKQCQQLVVGCLDGPVVAACTFPPIGCTKGRYDIAIAQRWSCRCPEA